MQEQLRDNEPHGCRRVCVGPAHALSAFECVDVVPGHPRVSGKMDVENSAVAAARAAEVAADSLEAKWRASMRFVPRRSLARARERSVCLSRQAAGGRIFLRDRK